MSIKMEGGEADNLPKIVDYEIKKQDIIEKAKEVFAKRGYYNTNISDISKSCGMGRTTIYQYFKNKDEIFYYSAKDALAEIKRKVEIIVEDDTLSFIEKLKKLVFEITSEYEHNYIFVLLAEIWIISKRERNEFLESLSEHIEDFKKAIKDLISQGIKAKEIKPVDSESMANTIYYFIESLIIQISTSNNVDINKKISSVNVLIDGLKA
ncbi:TetR/AcrR family transcriptional regulator [Sporanaerobacter sp.]|jgi:AcrR family transcriptional regulator|uniref:TetR/AcrR family transcriptional regulator n=1 Tax=Sporanaerobacter sp. TaxID=2010183 RepID=UPI003A0FD0A6